MNFLFNRKQKTIVEKEYINNFLNIIFKNYTLHEYESELWYINTTTKKFLFFVNEKNILVYNSIFLRYAHVLKY